MGGGSKKQEDKWKKSWKEESEEKYLQNSAKKLQRKQMAEKIFVPAENFPLPHHFSNDPPLSCSFIAAQSRSQEPQNTENNFSKLPKLACSDVQTFSGEVTSMLTTS